MQIEPNSLSAVLADLDDSDEKARRIVAEISDAQATWQPREGAWSIAQCLDHLSRTNIVYAGALKAALSAADLLAEGFKTQIKPGWLSRHFLRAIEPPPKGKISAPKKIHPAQRPDKGKALESFLRSQNDVREVVATSAKFNVNRIRFRNPFVRSIRFTVGTGLLIISAHDRRHLWQAEQVRRSEGFPQS